MTQSIKIGNFSPFTGPLALRSNGPQLVGGAQAWFHHFNALGGAGGRRVEFVVRDNGYDVDRTLLIVRELAEEHGVIAFLNVNGTPHVEAVLPYLNARGIPVLLPFGGAEEWFQRPQPGLFGVTPPFAAIGRLLARWCARDGHKRVAVLFPDYPAASVMTAAITSRTFDDATGGVGSAPQVCVPLGCTDGAAMADAIGRLDCHAVIVLVNWPELAAVAMALHARGRGLPLYSWSANVTEEVARHHGEPLEGMKGYSSLLVHPQGDGDLLKRYRWALKRVSPDCAPDYLSLQAFAQAMVFTRALDIIPGEITPASITDAFQTLDGYRTDILPPVSFGPDRRFGVDQVQPVELRHGAWVSAGPPVALLPAAGHPARR